MDMECITFEVGGQVFGIDIMSVREIRAWTPITRLPHVPHYVSGVVNLRGAVLPIIDLASRLGWPATAQSNRHAIIVTQLDAQLRGLMVEAVRDIITISNEALQAAPATTAECLIQFIKGLTSFDEQMIAVLNLEAIAAENAIAEAA